MRIVNKLRINARIHRGVFLQGYEIVAMFLNGCTGAALPHSLFEEANDLIDRYIPFTTMIAFS